MNKFSKKLCIALSFLTATTTLSGCGNKEKGWEYNKEDLLNFVNLEAEIKNVPDSQYNSLSIDGKFDYFKDTISANDLVVFNYSKIFEDINSSFLNADYLSYDVIKKYEAQVKEVKKTNEGESISILFDGNDDDIYGTLIWTSGSSVFTPIISIASESVNSKYANDVQIEFEEKYLQSEGPSWDRGKIALNVVGNIATIVLGYLDTAKSAMGGGVFGLLNLLGDTFLSESGPTLFDVVKKLDEINRKIDAITEKINVNHNQLLSELVKTQAQIDVVAYNQYEQNITAFNTDFIMPLNDVKRDLTYYVSEQLKSFVTESQIVEIYYSKDSSNKWQYHSASDTEGGTKYTINIDDFSHSKDFLAKHDRTVCTGFVDEFMKDVEVAVNKTTTIKPEGLETKVFCDHIVEHIFENFIYEKYNNNHDAAQELHNKAINFAYRLSGKDSQSIVRSYVERIKYMFNFAVEGKNLYRNLLSNLLLQLDINVGIGCAACKYAAINQKDLGDAYLAARKIIVDEFNSIYKLDDNYCYQTKNHIFGYFYRVRDIGYYSNTGNAPVFKQAIELRKANYYPASQETLFEVEEKFDSHNFVNSADNIRLSTRWKLMCENGLSDKKTYLDYLISAGALSLAGYNAYKDLVRTSYISKDDKMKVYAGDMTSRNLTDADKGLAVTCTAKGGNDSTSYFNIDEHYKYKESRSSGCWSGMIYEGTFVDGTNGNIDSNYKKICAYAKYDESHWYWSNDEHWLFIDNPGGNFFFALDYVSSSK